MKGVMIVIFSLLLGLVWMGVDISIAFKPKTALKDFANLSGLYTLDIEKSDFAYRKSDE